MSLIEQDDVVLLHQRIGHCFSEQHTVSHIFQKSEWWGTIFETNGVPDVLAKNTVHLVRYTLSYGHRSDSTGLCASNSFSWSNRRVLSNVFNAPLRDLGCFTRACLSDKTDDLPICNLVGQNNSPGVCGSAPWTYSYIPKQADRVASWADHSIEECMAGRCKGSKELASVLQSFGFSPQQGQYSIRPHFASTYYSKQCQIFIQNNLLNTKIKQKKCMLKFQN